MNSKIRKQYLLVFLAICAACFLAYFNSLTNPFIWDDKALVAENTLIRSWQGLGQSFTSDLYLGANFGSNFYRPLQTISYIFDYYFWQLDPFGYHLTNIILQVSVAYLVFLLLFNLLASLPLAAATGIFFAVSPLNTESVAYISGRAEMLMGFFAVLCLLLFVKSQGKTAKNPTLFYILSLVSFIFALLSKELAVVIPVIICGYMYYFLHERTKEKYYFIKRIIPFFFVCLIYLCLRLCWFNFANYYAPALTRVNWLLRLSVLPKVMLTYLKLLIFPVGLHMSRQFAWQGSSAGIFSGIGLLGLIIIGCIYLLKYSARNKVASFMLFWFLAFLIPQCGVFPLNTFVAEHFIYLSSISFFLLLAYILHKALRKQLFILAVIGFSAFYILLSAGRNFEWSNPIVFYRNIIKYSPQSFQAHNNLGLQYELKGLNEQAIGEYKLALEIKPDLLEARSNLANLYFKLKRFADAKKEYEAVEKICPLDKLGGVENNIANIYEAEGLFDQAIKKYRLALGLNQLLKFAHFNLARIYYAKGEPDAAGLHILESLSEITDTAKAADSQVVAAFIKNSGYVDSAEQFYNNLGINFAKLERWEAAVSAFKRVLELNPDVADYHYNLGLAYLNMGEKVKARCALKQALRINPGFIRARKLTAGNKLRKTITGLDSF
jgi:tetratricopeptide (TPR) repeat protein